MPSSVISSISYDAATLVLTITFVSGTVYYYKNVPEEIYQALKTSRMKGVYLNKQIKGRYRYEKIN